MIAPGAAFPEDDETKTNSRPWSGASGSRASVVSETPNAAGTGVADPISLDEDGVVVKVNLNLLEGDNLVRRVTPDQTIPEDDDTKTMGSNPASQVSPVSRQASESRPASGGSQRERSRPQSRGSQTWRSRPTSVIMESRHR